MFDIATRFPAFAANPIGSILLSPSFWKTIFAIAVMAGLYLGIKYVYDQYQHLNDVVAEQQVAAQNMQTEIATKQVSIDNLKFAIENQQVIINRIQSVQKRNEVALDRLRRKFAERDIGVAALADSKLIETEINKAVLERQRCFELATGAKQRENEVNEQCPELLKH